MDYLSSSVNFGKSCFIILAHEEKGRPHNAATGFEAGKVIFHVQGLAAEVSGRVGEQCRKEDSHCRREPGCIMVTN